MTQTKEAIEALESARAHILDAYRIWQADDVSAVPPPLSGAGAVIAKIDAVLSTLPIAGEGKELTEFQAGQWWLEELEKHWGTGETTPQTRRAAKVALSFAEAYFGLSSPGKDGGQSWDDPTLDGTDGAHPAWWRGCDHGYAKGLASVGKDGGQDGRTMSGETVLGMPVKAYMEETEFGGKFATHWSTIPKRCNPIRLFAEDDVRARLHQPASTALAERLTKALEAIDVYGSDTLSGRVDGPADKDWYRDGVREMRNRARSALSAAKEGSDR